MCGQLCLTVVLRCVRRCVCGACVYAQVIEFYANGTAIEEYKPRTPQQLGLHPRDVVLFAPLSRLAAPQVRMAACPPAATATTVWRASSSVCMMGCACWQEAAATAQQLTHTHTHTQ